ncbi:MAG: hypothetical protein IJO00_01985 [Clostridia bacterium]|nr:hypothetical protein [Clostridia bacterium]
MKELNLSSPAITLYISGNVFTINPDSAFAETVAILSNEAECQASLAEGSSGYSGARGFLCHAVNTLLGKNAINTIFGSSEPDLFDLCDIISYVCDRFAEYRKARINRLNQNDSPDEKEDNL